MQAKGVLLPPGTTLSNRRHTGSVMTSAGHLAPTGPVYNRCLSSPPVSAFDGVATPSTKPSHDTSAGKCPVTPCRCLTLPVCPRPALFARVPKLNRSGIELFTFIPGFVSMLLCCRVSSMLLPRFCELPRSGLWSLPLPVQRC